MVDIQKGAFSFRSYQIPQFSFNELPSNATSEILRFDFSPSGKFKKDSSEFELSLKLRVFVVQNEQEFTTVELFFKSYFIFKDVTNLSEIPPYFYINSTAIIFPYIRAFISTLSLQANYFEVIVLNLLNLSGLEKPLRENTTEVLNF